MRLHRAFFSQHKAQKEHTGLDESMPLYSVTPTCVPNPFIANMRIKDNFSHHTKTHKGPKRIVKAVEYSCDESEDGRSYERSQRVSGMKKSAVSYSSLNESVIQDASIRIMLAQEDERGESNKSILDVRMKNLKKLFGSSDGDSKMIPRVTSSARSSLASIHNPRRPKIFRDSKSKESIAGLLIKSIHKVPLEDVNEGRESPTIPSNAQEDSQPPEHHYDTINEHENEKRERIEYREKVDALLLKAEKKKQFDSSFEENTPSSNDISDGSSLESTNYDVLCDSKISTDEERGTNYRMIRTITRSDTFPPLRSRSLKNRLHRTDSETCPLHVDDASFLIKCISTNQIPFNFSRSLKPQNNNINGNDKANMNQNIGDDIQSDSQDSCCPLATSTPVEIRSPFFPETVDNEHTSIDTEKEPIITIRQPTPIGTDNTNDELSYVDESELSTSAYSLLQNSYTERNDRPTFDQVHQEEKLFVEKSDNSSRRGSFKDMERFDKLEEHNVLKFSSLSQSLPSLQQFQAPVIVESRVREDMDSKATMDSASKTSSSIESLIQSSCNDVHNTEHKNRQRRMLDLIKIIDTKMMEHPDGYNNNDHYKLKRKKRDRIYRNIHPTNLRKSLHNKCLKRRLQIYKSSEIIYPLNESTLPPLTPDSSSYNSSLESIIIGDTIIKSHSHRTESFSSRQSFTTERSVIDLKSHELAAKELTVDTQSSDSLRFSSNAIEMKELKPTNHLSSLSSIDHTIHKSYSICNINEISNNNEFTNITNTANITDHSCVSRPSPDHRQQDEASISPPCPLPAVPSMVSKVCQVPTTKAQPAVSLHRRSSDSDLSITPKGNSLGTDRSMTGFVKTPTAVIRTMNQDAFEMLEYPFLTMQQYPPGFILHFGGLVSSRSVKLLERISNLEEPESRDSWWKEVRMEVRSHARALACNVVVGYREETSICDDVCVLNAYGTAAVINLHSSSQDADNVFVSKGQSGTVINPAETEKSQQKPVPVKAEKSETDSSVTTSAHPSGKVRHTSESKDHDAQFQSKCSFCHLPYNEASVPFHVSVAKCAICKRARVPDVMFTTIELPENVAMTGRGCIIQATVCKNKKDLRGELNAKEISDCLPFLEYELHSLLLNKLKVKGMNAIFGLKLQVSVGERLIIGMAVGSAVFLTALPTPSVPKIASGNSWHKEEQLTQIQKTLLETVKKNREYYRLKPVADIENGRVPTSDTDESEEELPDLDFSVGTRDTCVLEVDDIEDMDRISLLMDDRPPDDFHVVNTQTIPGLDELEIVRNLQMFTQISRTKIPSGQFASMPSKCFAKLLQSVYFKLRKMIPCALCDMQFKLALPEPDEIQFTVIGMVLGLGDPVKMNKPKKKLMSHSVSKDQVKKSDDSDMIFNLDVDHAEISSDNASSIATVNSSNLVNTVGLKSRTRSPLRSKIHITHKHKHVPLKGRYGVDITPLSYLPGGRIERYLGNLNFFFIRESTSIRENGGLSGFTHSFIMEVLAIVRAHITALGGNAMVAFFMTKCVLLHSPHKNQGQSLINVGGDVVSVSYFANEKHYGTSNC
ncbi:uncharacterized protein LOC144474946 isoform X1 [Augochlora pura]